MNQYLYAQTPLFVLSLSTDAGDNSNHSTWADL
jgi:hypothetical protein